jgi:hypothetical protein
MKTMQKDIYLILFVILFVLSPTVLTAQSIYVPLNHPVYTFIERAEAKGTLRNALTTTKPLSRMEVAQCLVEIERNQEKSLLFSSVDMQLLDYYKEEFRSEIKSIQPQAEIPIPKIPERLIGFKNRAPSFIYKNGKNLIELQWNDFYVTGDIIAYQSAAITDNDTILNRDKVYHYTTGIQLWGQKGDHFGFFVDARNTKEWGSRQYPPEPNSTAPGLGWVKNVGTHQFHDETIAYLIYKASPFEIELGKNLNRWGPGYRGSLMLSDNATSYDLIKLKTKFWRIKFAHIFGYLVQYPRIVEWQFGDESGYKTKYAQKYYAAHRIELSLHPGINIGLQEAIVYGERGIELTYLNPLMFLRSAEHYLGDQDNALMGADISINIKNGWKWYGEFLMDDAYLKKLGTKYLGNKFGYIGGMLWSNPFSIANTALRVEYTRIKPFVYTHRYPINVYKHYNTCLGHSLPPNSDEWFLGLTWYPARKWSTNLEASYSRHGANTPENNVGGDINVSYGDNMYIGFLEGTIQRKKEAKVYVTYELLRDLFIKGEAGLLQGNGFSIHNVPGKDFTSNHIFFSVGLKY